VQSGKARPQKIANGTEYAIARATKLTDQEREGVLRPARDGFRALREGVATHEQWAFVSSAVTMAQAIEAQGIIRGMHEHFDAAERALDAIYQRVQDGTGGPAWGRSTTLYLAEIDTLRVAIHLHEDQLRVLGFSELQAAERIAQRNIRAAGGRVIQAAAASTSTHPTQQRLV
jgi:hypothetical protein